MDPERGLPSFEDNAFDLAIVDPPYGIDAANMSLGKRKGKRRARKAKDWDEKRPSHAYFRQLRRVSKHQIVWGGINYTDILPIRQGWIVWDKVTGSTSFADVEMAWTSWNTAARKYVFQWKGFLVGASKIDKQKRIHDCQKPVALYRWCLDNYAQNGWRILDTHVGSASSLIAFEEQGYEYVGFELDPDYYRESTKRLKAWRSQPRLFMAEEIREAMGGTQQELF